MWTALLPMQVLATGIGEHAGMNMASQMDHAAQDTENCLNMNGHCHSNITADHHSDGHCKIMCSSALFVEVAVLAGQSVPDEFRDYSSEPFVDGLRSVPFRPPNS